MPEISLLRKVQSPTHAKIGMRLGYLLEFELEEGTDETLAKLLDCSKESIGRLTQGKKELTLTELLALSVFFKTSLDKIVTAKF